MTEVDSEMEETNKPGTDLVALAKTWLAAPAGSTPIDFEEVWHLDGSTHRGGAKQRLERIMKDLVRYNIVPRFELVKTFTNSELGKRGPKATSYRMSFAVLKRYNSSSLTERGYQTSKKLHRAEEELRSPEGEFAPSGDGQDARTHAV